MAATMTPCEFQFYAVPSAQVFESDVARCRCATHGIDVEGYMSGSSGGIARCLIGKAEDSATRIVADLITRIEAIERKLEMSS